MKQNKETDIEKEVLKELAEARKKTEKETTPEWELNLPDSKEAKRKPGRPRKDRDENSR